MIVEFSICFQFTEEIEDDLDVDFAPTIWWKFDRDPARFSEMFEKSRDV
jgi:hypothetical protein